MTVVSLPCRCDHTHRTSRHASETTTTTTTTTFWGLGTPESSANWAPSRSPVSPCAGEEHREDLGKFPASLVARPAGGVASVSVPASPNHPCTNSLAHRRSGGIRPEHAGLSWRVFLPLWLALCGNSVVDDRKTRRKGTEKKERDLVACSLLGGVGRHAYIKKCQDEDKPLEGEELRWEASHRTARNVGRLRRQMPVGKEVGAEL